jgi:hypothetical protein
MKILHTIYDLKDGTEGHTISLVILLLIQA